MPDELWNVVNDVRNIVSRIDQRLADHIEDDSIHQRPPCEPHKSLITRLWAIGFAAFAGLISSLAALLRHP